MRLVPQVPLSCWTAGPAEILYYKQCCPNNGRQICPDGTHSRQIHFRTEHGLNFRSDFSKTLRGRRSFAISTRYELPRLRTRTDVCSEYYEWKPSGCGFECKGNWAARLQGLQVDPLAIQPPKGQRPTNRLPFDRHARTILHPELIRFICVTTRRAVLPQPYARWLPMETRLRLVAQCRGPF